MYKTDVLHAFDNNQTKLSKFMRSRGWPLTQPCVANWKPLIPELWARRLADIPETGLTFNPDLYKVDL